MNFTQIVNTLLNFSSIIYTPTPCRKNNRYIVVRKIAIHYLCLIVTNKLPRIYFTFDSKKLSPHSIVRNARDNVIEQLYKLFGSL